MRILSIRQPWVEAILRGLKDVENRSWTTPYRGPILLAAASKWSVEADAVAPEAMSWKDLPVGSIVGIARLCAIVDKKTAAVLSHGESRFIEGPKCWILQDAERLPVPVPYLGSLGLQYATPEITRRVEESLLAGTTQSMWLRHLQH